MKYLNLVSFIIFSFTMLIGCNTKNKETLEPKIISENYFNTQINDEYRYIENSDNQEVLHWIDKQNNLTQDYLSKIDAKKHLINLQKTYDRNNSFEIKKLLVTKNDEYFFLKRLPEENSAKLYYRKHFEGLDVMIYDPTTFNNDDEYVINHFKPSWSGKKVVISLTASGKEISELIIVDIDSKTVAPVILKNAWPRVGGDVQWLPNDEGFLYSFFPVLDTKSKDFKKNSQIVYYKLGTENEKVKPVFSKKNNPTVNIEENDIPQVSIGHNEDQYALGIVKGSSTYSNAYYAPIHKIFEKNYWKPLFSINDQIKDYIVVGDSIIFRTSKNAPNFKIGITSLKNPNFKNPKILVKERKEETITGFTLTKSGLFYVISKNGVKVSVYHRNNEGFEYKVDLPHTYGSIDLYAQDYNTSKLWFYTWGWATPKTRFEYDNNILEKKNLTPENKHSTLSDIVIEEIEVKGHDGAMIPLSLIYKNGITLNGSNRVLLDGYGAYGISIEPFFAMRRMLWVYEGGVYAVSHVRGGGEKGDNWHKGGLKESKPNTWKDFISCAEFLIANKYTTPDKLAVWSGSAGGILIGRAITERPDLFKAAIVEFGALNLLRYETIKGSANQKKEFGTIKDSLGFRSILEMDAYHHLKENIEYPSTFLTHGLNDPRLPAWQTLKFAAKIQKFNSSSNPNLILIDKDTGHAVDDTKEKEFERYANIMAFALWQTGHPNYQSKN